MKMIKVILGVFIQCLGLTICAPAFLLFAIGGWLTDFGEELRLD